MLHPKQHVQCLSSAEQRRLFYSWEPLYLPCNKKHGLAISMCQWFFFSFLGPHLQHMEVPRLGLKSELQLLAYTTATTMPDPGGICDLSHNRNSHVSVISWCWRWIEVPYVLSHRWVKDNHGFSPLFFGGGALYIFQVSVICSRKYISCSTSDSGKVTHWWTGFFDAAFWSNMIIPFHDMSTFCPVEKTL